MGIAIKALAIFATDQLLSDPKPPSDLKPAMNQSSYN